MPYLGPWPTWSNAVAQLVKATSRKVEGSIPGGVIGIFPFGSTVSLGSTQPLTEMSTRNIYWGEGGKGGRWVGLTTLSSSCTNCHEI